MVIEFQESIEAAFKAIVSSGMNEWVGGGDPRVVARINSQIIMTNLGGKLPSRVLDFGCGVGRVALGMIERFGQDLHIDGTDIVPEMIVLCENEINARFKNASFFCLASDNTLYEKYGTESAPRHAEDQFFASKEANYDLIYAFSVFTHLEKSQIERYLRIFRRMIAPSGRIIFSCFLLEAQSRKMIRDRFAAYPVQLNSESDDIHLGRKDQENPLAFVAASLDTIQELLTSTGWVTAAITFGSWRGELSDSSSFQDIVVATPAELPPVALNEQRYLELHSDVAATGVAARWHYARYGRNEGRKT
ncbi:MAG TPA: class I SAM-dependent methyltransferase [Caulobacteraceae bacterium]|jgi:SAM-dependent methyltransferase